MSRNARAIEKITRRAPVSAVIAGQCGVDR
jgi:hypothetical protein